MKGVLLILMWTLYLSLADDFEKLRNYTTGYNSFIADVYRELMKSKANNFLMCPSSTNIILSLVTTGAKEKTFEQLCNALRLPRRFQEIHDIFEPLTPKLQNIKDGCLCLTANKIYVSPDLEISKPFKTVADKVYDVDMQNVDFNNTYDTATAVNQWVEAKTNNLIKNIIEPDDLIDSTHTILVSTMLFAGLWRYPFTSSSTKRSCFYVNKHRCIETNMMNRTGYYSYFENSELNAKFLELTYVGYDLSMYIVLPNEIEGLATLENRLADILVEPKYKYEKVTVSLPKFRLESAIEMKPIMEAMGVKNAFEEGANFRGMGYYKNNTLIDKIIQNVFVEVDEKGTTAGAVGGEFGRGYGGGHGGGYGGGHAGGHGGGHGHFVPKVEVFKADHPFLFLIRLVELDYNVFVGRYTAP